MDTQTPARRPWWQIILLTIGGLIVAGFALIGLAVLTQAVLLG